MCRASLALASTLAHCGSLAATSASSGKCMRHHVGEALQERFSAAQAVSEIVWHVFPPRYPAVGPSRRYSAQLHATYARVSTLPAMSQPSLTQLIAVGTLPVGTEVFHPARRHADRAVTGRLVAGGIEVNGSVHSSPSGAAKAVTRSKAENGWTWWRVRTDGRTLSDWRGA
jgi:Restriction Enzyme Adenine Methylase Associated